MKEPSTEQIKERAKFLRQLLREKHNFELSQGHALEVLAKIFGYNDWNTASALSSKTGSKTNEEKPVATKFQTVGELKKFLSGYNDETKLVVNEYKWVEPDSNNSSSVSDFLAGTITSVCSLTYDSEIQIGNELCFELNTEVERNDKLNNFGKSSTQSFDKTAGGRAQRRIKFFHILDSFWNHRAAAKSDHKS